MKKLLFTDTLGWVFAWILLPNSIVILAMPHGERYQTIGLTLFTGSIVIAFGLPCLAGLILDEGWLDLLKRRRFRMIWGYEPYDPVI